MGAELRAAGSVALDIGSGYGALVVHTGPDRLGEEIEVTRVEDGFRTHVAVLTLETGDRTVHAAVFGSLPEGSYQLCAEGVGRPVTITGGAITEVNGIDPG